MKPGAMAALAAGAAVAASCGGAPAKQMTEPRSVPPAYAGPEPLMVPPDQVRARIEALDRDLAARAQELGLEPPPSTHGADGATAPLADPATLTCPRSPRPVCQDVCTLADSICDAADEICELARALPGDRWAAGRCTAGQDSCARARERCCAC